ncbi:MAG TPA: DICT sensory domain-containing protein [Chloroflexia bacterium]|nr:DICT sensory domain-containing protein [Chloroflexia bacterium]
MYYASQIVRMIDEVAARSDFNNLRQASGLDGAATRAAVNFVPSPAIGNALFTNSVMGMQAISHVIEDQALKMTPNQPFTLYSAFQKFSRVRPQEARYRRIVNTGNRVCLFGVPDYPLWHAPNLELVALEEHALEPGTPEMSDLWFVVLNSPGFVSMALVARELPSLTPRNKSTGALLYRDFEGFWTYDPKLIGQLVNILEEFKAANQGGRAKAMFNQANIVN